MRFYASGKTIESSYTELDRVDLLPRDRLVEIAWHLRQRDTQTALELVDRAERLTSKPSHEPVSTPALLGRMCLIRAEAAWLNSRFALADSELHAATVHFEATEDFAACGDASLLQYHLASDQGASPYRKECLQKSEALYAAAGDRERHLISLAWQALDESFAGASQTLERAVSILDVADFGVEPGVLGLLDFARAQLAFNDAQYGPARRLFEQAAAELRPSGLLRQAIAAIVNASAAIGNLNDFESQAEVIEEALALARETGWPQSLAGCLYSLGDAQQSLGRLAHARSAFCEARDLLQPVSSSRVYVVVSTFLAETDLRLGLDDEAYQAFNDARAATDRGDHRGLLPRILVGLSACLSRRSHGEEAFAIASEALNVSAGRDLVTERLALIRLAQIHGAHALPPPDGMTAASASLHYLEKLWSIQVQNSEWTPDDEILGEFAGAWERLGELGQALRYERLRIEALARESTSRAERQVVATQARQEALAARLESDHQRSLLESERRRQMVLEQLSLIGREITGSLSAADILGAVERHVHAMLDAALLSLWLLEDDMLEPAYCRADGRSLALPRIALDDRDSNAALAMREQREILVEQRPADVAVNHIPGTRRLLTALFAPLSVGTRTLGVISIGSAVPQAYGDQERLIFRNICAYTAIALANATNYEMLSVSHAKLIAAQAELERLANFDPLTGLCNRRHFMDAAQMEIARARRSGTPLCVVMIDVDHFKRINDTYGHLTGDLALQSIARTLTEKLRPSDTFARYGGEEMVALLPETDEESALAVAERFRATLASEKIHSAGICFSLTVSIGVARWRPSESTIEAALARADEALYRVKNGGRNGVALHHSSG